MACKFMKIQCLGVNNTARKKPEATSCSVSGDGLNTAIANQPAKFLVRTNTPDLVNLDVDIARIITDRTNDPKPEGIPLEFECLEENLHSIIYQPKIDGEYQLAIKWKGNHVNGSPFLVKVHANEAGDDASAQDDDVWLRLDDKKDRRGRK